LLASEAGNVFYKTAADVPHSGNKLIGRTWPRFATVREVRRPVRPATL
jgi:hypothetical protein